MALPLFAERNSVELFERMEVMSEREVVTRTEIMLDNYCKVLAIEGLTMSEMVKRDIYPAVDSYIASLCKTAEKKSRLGASSKVDEELVRKLSDAAETMWTKTEELDRLLADARSVEGAAKQAAFFADRVLPVMQEIRIVADRTETETPKGVWPYPSYGELLFGV